MKRGDLTRLFLLAGLLCLALSPAWAQDPQKPRQNPPPTVQEEQPEYTEEEYDAYDKAVNEPDLAKRADLLIAFMDKYPKSKLQSYIVSAYENLSYEFQSKQQWENLISLCERWTKIAPDDLRTIAYIAEAASKAGNSQKYLEYALQIFAVKPSAESALDITQTYKKIGDEAKHLEWKHKLFGYPEYAGDFMLRFDFVQKYAAEKNLSKAAEYAQLTLKSLDVAKKPEALAEADWKKHTRTVRRNCHWFIAMNHYEDKQYKQVIRALEEALKAEIFDGAFYYIGMSQWKLDQIEEAQVSFAAAELLKGEFESQAKEHMESLYRALHNNTLIGVDKVYRKAQARLDVVKTASVK
ncbi:MAG: hypothetical protein FJW35_12105 [Acidobacteria bacterium]|nr:hypothetical protein [Acidobacteriota bacterium]